MVRLLMMLLPPLALVLGVATSAEAHGGGLNACGCHHDRRAGTCHCHHDRGCGCDCEPSRCERE